MAPEIFIHEAAPRVSRALVVLPVIQLRGAGIDVPVAAGAVPSAFGEAIAVIVPLVGAGEGRPAGSSAVVVEAVADLGGSRADRGMRVVAVPWHSESASPSSSPRWCRRGPASRERCSRC